jgi:hypothetical protein
VVSVAQMIPIELIDQGEYLGPGMHWNFDQIDLKRCVLDGDRMAQWAVACLALEVGGDLACLRDDLALTNSLDESHESFYREALKVFLVANFGLIDRSWGPAGALHQSLVAHDLDPLILGLLVKAGMKIYQVHHCDLCL